MFGHGFYLVGGFVTAVMAARVSYETMRRERSGHSAMDCRIQSVDTGMGYCGKWRRNLLSTWIAIVGAFIFFVFVTIRLKGV